ncbi:UTP-glucose-1-phosphate uridylyltransferase [Paraphaeosphaeria minitans]|uniref:UTP--glucose-1-phosphate uridylyltransferase n=1 Tax=Paraphaeosphaeria minitans TaxID=565426 RepID=A0A9P6GB75_9PLEO|nr:UTP-glucose-1-phosphate uridylyltransferase [Paraphaeosphaeria minitans]
MASRAIPSHLKPSAAAGNGDSEGGQRHHGKTASHFVRTMPIVPGPAPLRVLYHHFHPQFPADHRHPSPWPWPLPALLKLPVFSFLPSFYLEPTRVPPAMSRATAFSLATSLFTNKQPLFDAITESRSKTMPHLTEDQAFENTSTNVAASQMRNALNKLADTVTNPEEKKRFETEMDNFFALFRRYLNDKAKGTAIDWNRIAPPKAEQLGGDFKKVSSFQSRIPSIPKIVELDHLTITGPVNLGRGVTMKGTVIIVASEGQTIDIPPGSILENVVVQGSLRLLEH